MSDSIRQLESMRRHRARASADLSIAKLVASTAADASRTHKRLGELIELWERLVPAELVSHTSLTAFRAGVLHVSVDSSSTAFELDRRLRSGLTDALRREFRGSLVRVRTRMNRAPGAASGTQTTPAARRARRK